MTRPLSIGELRVSGLSSLGDVAANFPKWPPPLDAPVVIDSRGTVVSRVGDPSWDLTPWRGKALRLNFGDGETKGGRVSAENARVFRFVSVWWLVGPNACTSATGIYLRHQAIKPLFVVCSEAGIPAIELSRQPRVIEILANRVAPSCAHYCLTVLHDLWLARDSLGFTLLDQAGLRLLNSLLPEHTATQTAYIPPRIWSYQVLRLKECLDDFAKHRSGIEECFRFCVSAYANNAGGSVSDTFAGMKPGQLPFTPTNYGMKETGGRVFHGPFRETAERFGIDSLLARWVTFDEKQGIRSLSSYLSLVSQVGLAYALNFTQMRVDEGAQLRVKCLRVETDPVGIEINLIGGITSKTTTDADAWWIASPSIPTAIDAMISVARLRTEVGRHNPNLDYSSEELDNPLLQAWVHEPWGAGRPKSNRRDQQSYAQLLADYPRLLDSEQIRITEDDHSIAHRLTLGLDRRKFEVGATWPFAWHQLRRTGAVNMLSSGLVSEPSLQYQLKQTARATSLYYGQNYYRLSCELSSEARGFYLREMYHSVLRQFETIRSDRFVSPWGTQRKERILSPISAGDHASLLSLARSGSVRYKETFLGGCANPGPPCPLGGISNISGCMGHGDSKPCEWVLLDREKVPLVRELHEVLSTRIAKTEPGSLQHDALSAQIQSAERALNETV